MRTIVLYQSSTGSAERYAQDIASAVGATALPLKKFKWKTLGDYECVVFGGWVRNGVIQGLNDFLAHYDDMMEKKQDIIIFSSGMSIPTKDGRAELISSNILDLYHVRYYQLRGNFDMEKLSFVNKFIMKRSLQFIAQDESATPERKALLNLLDRSIEYYDQEGVGKVVALINRISTQARE